MAAYREKEYSLYSRKNKDAIVWYCYIYNTDGQRISKSTGIGYTRQKDRARTRREAEAYCIQLLESGGLEESDSPTLEEWAEVHHFWDWRRSSFVRDVLVHSPADRPGITESYISHARGVYEQHIRPYHGNRPIEDISPFDCEQLLMKWITDGASHKTANNRKSVYSRMMSEYERERKMRNPKADFFNPWRMVRPLAIEKNKRGGLTLAEGGRLLDPTLGNLSTERDRLYFTAVRVAFLTGLRIGEVCGLFTDDVRDIIVRQGDREVQMSYLAISRQYNSRVKSRTLVKDKDTRNIPITQELRTALEPYLTGSARYVFSFHPRQEHPISSNRLRDWLYTRMEEEGIEIKDREARNITFHSSRRYFNTLLRRAQVDNAVIQRFTGHDSDEMTEHYDDMLPQDLQIVAQAQRRMIEGSFRD